VIGESIFDLRFLILDLLVVSQFLSIGLQEMKLNGRAVLTKTAIANPASKI